MQVPIEKVQVMGGRRRLDIGHVQKLADSIRELGLLNPITVNLENVLIAGLHRLEAVKMLGWTEVECTVSSLEGMQAELAEIDENIVRSDLTALEYGEILLRRKELYETLHPETKHGGDRKSGGIKTTKCRFDNVKSFAQDTAEKLGVVPRTIERQIETARKLTPEAKEIIKGTGMRLSKKAAMELSRLEPGEQEEAASLLAAKEIRKVGEYKDRVAGKMEAACTGPPQSEPGIPQQRRQGKGAVDPAEPREPLQLRDSVEPREPEKLREPLRPGDSVKPGGTAKPGGPLKPGDSVKLGGSLVGDPVEPGEALRPGEPMETRPPVQPGAVAARPGKMPGGGNASLKEIIAELKDPDKDCSGTPDSFLLEYAAFVQKFHREIGWYSDPYYDTVYPFLTDGQLAELRGLAGSICTAVEEFLRAVEAARQKG